MRFTPILAAFVFCLVKVQPSTSRVISVEVQKRAPSNFANEIGDAGVEKRVIWGYYFKDMGDGDVAKDIGDGGVEKHMEDGEVEKRTIFGYYFKDMGDGDVEEDIGDAKLEKRREICPY
ncbi:hypothetical protein C8R43DRAFT_1136100 [Mycena crocata]|nr:hypothetical protein C8R43DRAFT_1136100 [Mycena crocata]